MRAPDGRVCSAGRHALDTVHDLLGICLSSPECPLSLARRSQIAPGSQHDPGQLTCPLPTLRLYTRRVLVPASASPWPHAMALVFAGAVPPRRQCGQEGLERAECGCRTRLGSGQMAEQSVGHRHSQSLNSVTCHDALSTDARANTICFSFFVSLWTWRKIKFLYTHSRTHKKNRSCFTRHYRAPHAEANPPRITTRNK